MQPAQLYETTIHNRDTGDSFSFVVVPRRSLSDPDVSDSEYVLHTLRLEPRQQPSEAEPWSLPFLIDSLMGRTFEYPWILEPGGDRQGQTPTPFAQYLAYSPVIPFEESPLQSKSLAEILAATGGTGAVVGFAVGHPVLLLVVPAGIILCGAATGIAQALRIGLRAHILRLMGVEDPGYNEPSEH